MNSRTDAWTRRLAIGFAIATSASTTLATTLRIAEYNLDSEDQGSNDNIDGPNAGIPTVVEAMGEHHIGTNAQPVDVLAVTECLNLSAGSDISTTLPDLVGELNTYYGAGTYAYVNQADPTTTSTDGPSGLIYDTKTVQVLGTTILADSGSGAPRAPMRFELRPAGLAAYTDFYLYVSHYKADDLAEDMTRRNVEAAEIRSDADALGPNAHIIYSGDTNLSGGSTEPAYATLTASGNGKAYDPVAQATSYVSNWTSSSNSFNYLYSHSTTSLSTRLDLELVSKAVLTQPGLQLASDNADPYDPKGFPSWKYPYAYEVFGNNGSTAEGASSDSSKNTAFADLSNASTVMADVVGPNGSDHLPVVADYTVVTPEPLVVGQLIFLGIPMARRRPRRSN